MNTKLPRGTLDRLWADPAHWNQNGDYACVRDPRFVVPSRPGRQGEWQYNEAHRTPFIIRRGPLLLWILFLGLSPVVVCSLPEPTPPWAGATAISVLIALQFSVSFRIRDRLAAPARFEVPAQPGRV